MAEKDLILKLKAQDDISATLGKVGKVIGEAFAVKKVAEFGKTLFNSFSQGEASLIRFNTVLDNSVGVTDELRESFQKVAQEATAFGVDDEEVAESLANLYQKTGEVTSALELHKLALNASAQTGMQYSESIAMIQQVMTGRTIPAIKALNLNVEDTTDVMAVLKAMQEKTMGAVDKTMDSALVATNRYKQAMDNLKQSLGQSLATAFKPFVDFISKMVEKFLALPQPIKTVVSVIVSLGVALAVIVPLLSAVITALPFLSAGFTALKIALGALSGQIGWITLVLTGIASAVIFAGNYLGWWKSESSSATSITNQFGDALDKVDKGAIQTGRSISEITSDIQELNKKIKELNKDMANSIIASGEKQMELNGDIGGAIVDQQVKVADIEKEIAEERKKFIQDQDTAKLNNLIQELAKEQLALQGHKDLLITYETEVAEAKRRVSLTEFERRIEDINKEKLAEQNRLKEKLVLYAEEMKILQEQNKLLLKENSDYTNKVNSEARVRAEVEEESTRRILQARSMVNQTTSAFGSGINFLTGNSTSTSNTGNLRNMPIRINDGIVQNGKVITTHPDDYLIAMKNPNSLGGGGVIVNVYGDVSGQDLIDKVQNALMKSLRFDTKFTV